VNTIKKILFLLFLALLVVPVQVEAARPGANSNGIRFTHLRVGLLSRFNGRSSIVINNTQIVYSSGTLNSASGFTVRPYSANQLALYDGSNRIRVLNSPVQISAPNAGLMQLDGHTYRGAIEFARLGGSGVTAVNIVSMEEYLFSVVPSEMPATWHPEALKAQAVAARTYALNMITRGNSHVGFDLCDRVCCQVYRGVEWEHENSTQAVLATSGLVALFNGQPIEAVYFASSGGRTENSENVWQSAVPYLRSVADPQEFEPVMWTRTFTLNEISHLLTQNGHGAVGAATAVSIGSTLPSGRIESLIIHGTSGQLVLERESIRTFFSPLEGGSLQSRNFAIAGGGQTIEEISIFDGNQMITTQSAGLSIISAQEGITTIPTQALTTASNTITLNGRGFGHGVGMSQRGAEGMARQGHNFREILTHFYRGITIE